MIETVLIAAATLLILGSAGLFCAAILLRERAPGNRATSKVIGTMTNDNLVWVNGVLTEVKRRRAPKK